MGKLKDLIERDQALRQRPKPDAFTQRQEYVEHEETQRRIDRRDSFIRNSLWEIGISAKEMRNIVEKTLGSKAEADKMFAEGKKTSVYKILTIKAFKEQNPAKYQEAEKACNGSQKKLLEAAEKNLSPAMLELLHVRGVIHSIGTNPNKAAFLQNIEGSLTAQHEQELTQRIENYRDILDIPLEEQQNKYMHGTIETLRGKADTELADNPEKRQQYLDALQFADDHLTKLEQGVHATKQEMEKDVQHMGATFSEKSVTVTAKTLKNGMYDNVFSQYTQPSGIKVTHVSPEHEDVVRDLNQNCLQPSERMKEGIRKLITKMQQMQILKPGEVAPGEDGGKIYGFRQFVQGKERLENALKSGNVDEIIAASEEHKKNWQDMEELYQIARENLGVDPALFPGNLDSCRNVYLPAHFTFDLATTAAINGAFLVYNYLHEHNVPLEQYLENPLSIAYGSMEQKIEENKLDTLATGKPFEDTLDMLYDFNGRHADNIFTKAFSYTISRSAEFLNYCEPDKEKQQENGVRSQLYYTYHNDMLNMEKDRFGVLKSKNPDFRIRTLQNLITVKPGDAPVSSLIDGKNLNTKLFRQEDFSLDHYVADHADYEGMIARTNALLAKVQGKDLVFTTDILEAAQEAYAKVLQAHIADKDTPGYNRLKEAYFQLESLLPEDASPEVRNRMATRRDALEMALPGGSATSMWTAQFFGQLEETKAALPEANRNQLNAIAIELRNLKEVTDPYLNANEQGEFPIVRGEDYAKIQEAYRKAADALGTFVPEAGNEMATNVAGVLNGLKTVLGQDLTALSAAKQGQEMSLGDMLKAGRTLKVQVNGPVNTVGDMASSRMQIDVPGPNGTTVKGFFTANNGTYSRAQADQMLETALNHAVEKYGHPELKNAVKTLLNGELEKVYNGFGGDILGQGDNLFRMSRQQVRSSDNSQLFATFIGKNADAIGGDMVQALKTEVGSKILMDVFKELSPLSLTRDYNRLGLNGNIDRRNAAMSTVADILGVDSVIAGSRPMTIVQDGKEITGTFMNYAEGWDVMNQNPENPLLNAEPQDMITKESMTSLADLQVLDFICGNVDRHGGNMFYKFDGQPPKFTGVQGIDNDYSFCLVEGNNIVKLDDLGIITEKTAQKVMALTPAMLETTLSPYGLSKEEIDAAWGRTHRLQEKIRGDAEYFRDKPADHVERGRLRVVREDELQNFGPDSELFDMGLFRRVIDAPKTCINKGIEKTEKGLDERMQQLRNSAPEMERALNGVVDANRGFFIGSKNYKNAMKGLREIAEARNAALDGADPQKLAEYAQRVEDAKDLIGKYLENKTKIPENRRNDLEKRRIAAMTNAYAALEREQVITLSASSLATVAQNTKSGITQQKLDNFAMKKAAVTAHINAKKDYVTNSQPADDLECDVMKKFREQARDSKFELESSFDGTLPTEEQKMQLTNKVATVMAYTVLKMHIRALPQDQKAAVYDTIQQNPQILDAMKAQVLGSKAFNDSIQEGFFSDPKRYASSMQNVSGAFSSSFRTIRNEVTQSLTQAHQQRLENQPAPQMKDPQVEAPKVENPALNAPQ